MNLPLTILMMGLSLGASASDDSCAIPGEPVHWVIDYCMFTAETDDFLNPAVQECFRKQETKGMGACEIKTKYKQAMCKMKSSQPGGSWESCMADDTYAGPTVRNGGV